MIKVLFVCLGNICRSPAAEAVFKNIVDSNSYFIDSAGTDGYHSGEAADSRMRAAAANRGIDITSRSRKLLASDLESFDYIISMDDSNYSNTVRLSPKHKNKVMKFADFLDGEFKKFDKVPDPYYGGSEGFDLVLDLLENGSKNLLKEIEINR